MRNAYTKFCVRGTAPTKQNAFASVRGYCGEYY